MVTLQLCNIEVVPAHAQWRQCAPIQPLACWFPETFRLARFRSGDDQAKVVLAARLVLSSAKLSLRSWVGLCSLAQPHEGHARLHITGSVRYVCMSTDECAGQNILHRHLMLT